MSITVNATPCVEINCDACGAGDNEEYEANYHWPSEQEAIENAGQQDWLVTEDGIVLCSDCQCNAEMYVPCPTCERHIDQDCDHQHREPVIPFGCHQARIDALVEKVRRERAA